MGQAPKQTADQRRLQQICDKLFRQKFPVVTIDDFGSLLAGTATGFQVVIVRQADGHYWGEAQFVGNSRKHEFFSDPDSRDDLLTVRAEILRGLSDSTPMPTENYMTWGVLDGNGSIVELLIWMPNGTSTSKDMAAPFLVRQNASTERFSRLYRNNILDPKLFWQEVRTGNLIHLGKQHLRGYCAIMLAPDGTSCAMLNGQQFARPEDWPKLRKFTTAQLRMSWSLTK